MDEYVSDNKAEAADELEKLRREEARAIQAQREELTKKLDAHVPGFTARLLTCIGEEEIDTRLLAQMERYLPGFTEVITILIKRQMDANMIVRFLICEGSLEHPEKNAIQALMDGRSKAGHKEMVLRSAQVFEEHGAS